MIDKYRDPPVRIKQGEALLRRLPAFHRKRQDIEDDLGMWRAGLRGEKNVDYHLSFIPNSYHIMHHVRLKNHDNQYYFQIDTLMLTPSFIYSLEVKNYSGELFFDKASNQLIKIKNGKKEGYANPIIQAQRHAFQLRKWFKKHKFPPLPIEYGVVISNPATIIETTPDNYYIFKTIFHADILPSKTTEITKKYKNITDEKTLKKIVRTILKHHEPLVQNILKVYGIERSEILPGVQCPKCKALPMKYEGGKWTCKSCQYTSKNAHEQALRDYALLLGTEINNRVFCAFLGIPSRNSAYKLLKKMNFPVSGSGRWQKYNLVALNFKE